MGYKTVLYVCHNMFNKYLPTVMVKVKVSLVSLSGDDIVVIFPDELLIANRFTGKYVDKNINTNSSFTVDNQIQCEYPAV